MKLIRVDQLKICRLCIAIFFSADTTCPVCESELGQATKDEVISTPTLDSIIRQQHRISETLLRQKLDRGDLDSLGPLRFVNVGNDPLYKFHLTNLKRLGYCDFCECFQVGPKSCSQCRRKLRYTDFTSGSERRVLSRNFDSMLAEVKKDFEALSISIQQLKVFIGSMNIPHTWRVENRELLLRDFVIQYLENSPDAKSVFEELISLLNSPDEIVFFDVILPRECAAVHITLSDLKRYLSAEKKHRKVLGAFTHTDNWGQLRVLYQENDGLFRENLRLTSSIMQSIRSDKRKKRRGRHENSRVSAPTEVQAPQGKVEPSDWWMNRSADPFPRSFPAPYVQRSWKHRFRKPW